jgi:hypothetical protein
MQRGYIVVLIVGGILFVIGRIIAAAGNSQFAGMLYMKTYISTNSLRAWQVDRIISNSGNRCLKINNCSQEYQSLKEKKRV